VAFPNGCDNSQAFLLVRSKWVAKEKIPIMVIMSRFNLKVKINHTIPFLKKEKYLWGGAVRLIAAAIKNY